MGILKEMFSDGGDNFSAPEGELLAKGDYESKTEEIMKGYKAFQKKYVFKSLIWKMLLVALALASSVMMIMTSEKGEIMPVLCLMISVCVGIWFISQPINNRKNLVRSLDNLSGTKYEAEFYTDKVKISTIPQENNSDTQETEISDVTEESQTVQPEQAEQSEADLALDGDNNEIPATVIHLDSPIVDLMEKEDIFILVVKKSYVFIIPKTAFSNEENEKIREKLSVIMGIRYKISC